MKKYKVFLNDQADFDLQQIFDYIYGVLENPSAARKVIDGILARCEDLSSFPKAGPVRFASGGFDIRFIHFGHYTIAFAIDDEKKEVVIYRIIYSRRNITSELLMDE